LKQPGSARNQTKLIKRLEPVRARTPASGYINYLKTNRSQKIIMPFEINIDKEALTNRN
jgi:hypothetical protein